MLRVHDAVKLTLPPHQHADAIATLAPEYAAWLDDDDPPCPHLALTALADRADDLARTLDLDADELHKLLMALVPEIMHDRQPVPTAALPGTPDKVRVMAERRERGEALFARSDPGSLPAHLGFRGRVAGNTRVRAGLVEVVPDGPLGGVPVEAPDGPPETWPVGRRGQLLLWPPDGPRSCISGDRGKRRKRKKGNTPAGDMPAPAWVQRSFWDGATATAA
jgi:hypothetical protein